MLQEEKQRISCKFDTGKYFSPLKTFLPAGSL